MTAQVETSAEQIMADASSYMASGRFGKAFVKFRAAEALFLRAMECDKAANCACLADECIQKIRDEIDYHEEQLDALRDMLEETKR